MPRCRPETETTVDAASTWDRDPNRRCARRGRLGDLAIQRSLSTIQGSGGAETRCRAHLPYSSVAQRQSIRLLTGGLLVRIHPEEPAPQPQ